MHDCEPLGKIEGFILLSMEPCFSTSHGKRCNLSSLSNVGSLFNGLSMDLS